MGNEYNSDGKLILRDTSGNQMSLPRFFQLALVGEGGAAARPTSYYHTDAWDMGAPENQVPVRTPVFGTVIRAEQTGWNGGMGTCVIIDEGNGRTHNFFHMVENSLVVSVGDSVSQGDKLGMIGNTGDSHGAHLHYDVQVGGSRIGDPMLAYDCATLPSGWNFGDAVANGNNWDYIPLDQTATDYGPPGGETPSEPFFTDGCCYDVSTYQYDNTVQTLCNDSTTGGLILRFAWNSDADGKVASHLAKCQAANVPVGFYSASSKNITANGAADYRAMLEAQLEILYTTLGIKPEDCKLGIWLDLETWGKAAGASGCGISASPDDTIQQVELFREVFGTKNYPVLGLYCNRNELTAEGYGLLNASTTDWKEFPFWYSRPGASRSTVDSELSSYGLINAYLWQDGFPNENPGADPWSEWWSDSKTYVHKQIDGNWIDNDTVLQPIPTAGGGGGGGGGGSYTEVIKVTVDVIPPKRIYFSPVPGIIPTLDTRLDEREQEITITTDADNASLYYTLDGSSPYQYTTNNGTTAYTVAANALLYSSSITINKDTHIRVVAVPSGTSPGMTFDEPLAKGSGTFLFQYQSVAQTWEEEQKSYATSDGAVSFFEENKQAFLRLHVEQTDEEILYTEVYRHDTQVAESDASDSASKTEEGGQPTYDGSDEPTETSEEEGDDNVSDE